MSHLSHVTPHSTSGIELPPRLGTPSTWPLSGYGNSSSFSVPVPSIGDKGIPREMGESVAREGTEGKGSERWASGGNLYYVGATYYVINTSFNLTNLTFSSSFFFFATYRSRTALLGPRFRETHDHIPYQVFSCPPTISASKLKVPNFSVC